ncbi:MAG: YqgE/AlgH family protein [Rhodocyclaceae bacterium]|nr:YqgE/AlgH family protein [Rhodocyclaceae bacterium]
MNARRNLLRSLLALALAPVAGRSTAAKGGDASMLLLASEKLRDPRFRGTVLAVMRHGPGGPLGVVLNRPTRFSRGQILPNFGTLPERGEPVFHGGPVARTTLFYMARFPVEPPSVLTLAPGVYMGLDLDGLRRILEAGMAPQALRIYAGYAGWAPGQLQREIAEGSWHVLPMDAGLLFEDDTRALYPRLIARTRLIPA